MKLSEKGINRLYAQVWMNQEDLPQDEIFGFETLEFQSDDFEDCVMLTVEEAKILHELALSTIRFLRPESAKALLSLKKRIEQAEKKDEV